MKKEEITLENKWIPVSMYNSVRIAKFKGVFQIQKGKRFEQTSKPEWVIVKTWDEKTKGSIPV